MLKLADNLSLPVDTVTQAVGILAKRRAGKSYTARRFAEQLHRAGQQIVIVDPKGDWWGIRSSSDGKSPGLPVVIIGGERGDVPLEAGSGEVVAKLVVEERVSVLLDLSFLRKHEVATFMTAFLESLYRLKAREVYRTPVMLIIDEADAIAPQAPMKGEERMLGAAEDIVRRGGQRGIGCTLITQRSAVLNKNVLTQIQILIALRTIAPQDLKAINAWVDVHGTEEERETLMESLPALPTGDAWFWSPGWPTVDGIFKRSHVLPIETFDSGATPKPGEKRREPKNIADVDLESLKRQMSETIARAKADDPKELRRQVADLQKQIKGQKPAAADPATVDRAVAAAVQKRDAEWRKSIAEHERIIGGLKGRLSKIEQLAHVNGEAKVVAINPVNSPPKNIPVSIQRAEKQPVSRKSAGSDSPAVGGDLPTRQQRFLDAAAALTTLGTEVTRKTVSAWVGVHPRGGSVGEVLKDLEDRGLIVVDRGRIEVTEAGQAAAGHVDPGEAIERAKSGLTARQAKFFEVICEAYPEATTREAIAERFELHPRGGSLGEDLGRLVRRGLVEANRGQYRAREFLFVR